MARIQNRWLTLLFAFSPAFAADLSEQVRALLESSPVAARAFVGIRIDSVEGETLVQHNADRPFVPASNMKLFTTALGLLRLGPEHRFHTLILAEAAPDGAGRIRGSLTLAGSGDPNLSGREIPYRVDSPAGNPLAAIEDLASQVVARGVRRIDGDIVGDDALWPWEPFPAGWSIDDPLSDYGAPVSALSINDNAITLTLRPGDPAHILLSPPIEYFHIDNRVRVGAPQRIRIERDPGSRQLRIWGLMPPKNASETRRLAVDDPALFAAIALRDALTRRGVAVHGRADARHWFPSDPQPAAASGVELARRTSPPLIEKLRIIDKVSQNLHAEMLLRAVGHARRNAGTREAGFAELRDLATEAGIEPAALRVYDGYGLSRMNLVTPSSLVKLLRFVYNSPQRDNWLSLLPVAAEDGSLRFRFRNTPASGRIRAKTGTLSRVTALSGYAEHAGGSTLAFAVLVNNHNAPAAEVRAFLDKICLLMIE